MSRADGDPMQTTLPESTDTSAQRAARERVTVDPLNDGEVMVRVGEGDVWRVTARPHADGLRCRCPGHRYRRRCAHVEAVRRARARGDVTIDPDAADHDPDTLGSVSQL